MIQSLDSEVGPVCVLNHFSLVQLCETLDCSPPVSTVRGILQTRILEWVAMSSWRDLPRSGIKTVSPVFSALQEDSLPLSRQGSLKLVLLDSNPSLAG